MSIPLCTTTTLSSFVSALRARGVPVDAELQRARLPVLAVECTDAWVPYLRMREFISHVATREGLPELGWDAGEMKGSHALDPHVCAAVFSAPTLMHALLTATQVCTRQSTHLRIWLDSCGASIRVCHSKLVGPAVPGYDIQEAYTTMCMIAIARRFLGPKWLPARVIRRRVASAPGAPAPCDPFADQGVPMLEHDDHAGVEVRRDQIWAPNPHEAAISPATGVQSPPGSLGASLRGMLRAYVGDGRPGIRLAADIAGMSVRGLQRGLAQERTSFREVLELTRRDVACAALADEHVPIAEIALDLGYSDQSAFTRAFGSWTGISPHAYREQLLQAQCTLAYGRTH